MRLNRMKSIGIAFKQPEASLLSSGMKFYKEMAIDVFFAAKTP